MREALQYCAWAVGLCLNVAVISALLRGPYRRYPFVFLYSATLLLSTLFEIALQPAGKKLQQDYYWMDEIILDILVFSVVIAFIGEAAQYSKRRLVRRWWLIPAAAVIFAVSFYSHHGLHLNHRMTLVSRDLNLCAVILDVLLWSLLIGARSTDRRLLLLSGGLGLQLTGAIMGESLRNLSHHLFWPGTMLEVLSGFAGLYIWWRALRLVPSKNRISGLGVG